MLKIFTNLLTPNKNQILVNKKPIKKKNITTYHNMLGIVIQDDQLFASSIADNINFFSKTPEQNRIKTYAQQTTIHKAISSMPMGYTTLIGDMDTALSNKQKQRILITRALYHQPNILLLNKLITSSRNRMLDQR